MHTATQNIQSINTASCNTASMDGGASDQPNNVNDVWLRHDDNKGSCEPSTNGVGERRVSQKASSEQHRRLLEAAALCQENSEVRDKHGDAVWGNGGEAGERCVSQ